MAGQRQKEVWVSALGNVRLKRLLAKGSVGRNPGSYVPAAEGSSMGALHIEDPANMDGVVDSSICPLNIGGTANLDLMTLVKCSSMSALHDGCAGSRAIV